MASSKEKRPSEAEIQKATMEINRLIEKPELYDLLSEMTKDEKLRAKAKANPLKFLEQRGIEIPDKTDFSFEEKIVALRIKITITLCLRICRRVGNFIVCATICISGTVSL